VRLRTGKIGQRLVPYDFVLPALAVYALFVLVPIGSSVRLSFLRWPNAGADPVFAGLANYRALFIDPVFWHTLLHNALLIILSLAVQLPLAFVLALLLSYPIRCRALFRTAFFTPMVMPSVAIAVLWGYVYLPGSGLLDQFIRLFAQDYSYGEWLSDPNTAMGCVFVAICWRYTGFHMVLFMAGIAAIPSSVYEAARVDGASEWQICRHVTLPLLTPVILISALLSVIGSLKYFDLVFMMTQGTPQRSRELLATYVYRLAFASNQGRYGYGSAVAVVLLVIAMFTAVLVRWYAVRCREDDR